MNTDTHYLRTTSYVMLEVVVPYKGGQLLDDRRIEYIKQRLDEAVKSIAKDLEMIGWSDEKKDF
jgi:hypothetical protein